MYKKIFLFVFISIIMISYASADFVNGGAEYGNMSGWNTYVSNPSNGLAQATSVYKYTGTYSFQLGYVSVGEYGKCYMNQTVDVTGKETIDYMYKVLDYSDPEGNASIYVDGDLVKQYDYTEVDWTEDSIDVTNYTGDVVVQFQIETDNADDMWICFDDITLSTDFASGDGSSGDPYIITNVYELQAMNDDLDAYYELGNDIDASITSTWNGGAGFLQIGNQTSPFEGVFDGNGSTITNLYINRPSTNFVGLFGYAEVGQISDMFLENASITGNNYVGPLAGYAHSEIIDSVGTTGTATGAVFTGGVIGMTGGIGTTTNIYSLCTVSGTTSVGGAIGRTDGLTIYYSYSAGSVSGSSYVGGFVGESYGSTATSCYWDTETSGQSTSALGTEKTTLEMLQESTYTGWDFDDIWYMDGYPILQFEEWEYVDPIIYYPGNGTEVNVTYPPLETSIQFVWLNTPGASSTSYQLARDSNYNSLVASGTTTAFTKTLSLGADEYWFKVRYYYDTEEYSNWTESQFTINATTGDYGTAVHGVVYKSESGSQTALSGANVIIYNDTYSRIYTTSSNGYFLFQNDGLTNATYYLQASKDGYETSSLNIVTLTLNETVTKNIILEPETAPNYITPHYVRLIPMYLWLITYDDLTVTVYEGDSATALYSEITGDDGAVSFELSETTKYRITVKNTERGIDDTFYITPSDDEYILPLGMGEDKYAEEDILSDITYSMTKSRINLSAGYINISYSDPSDTFTSASILITDTNNTTIYSSSSSVDSGLFSTIVNASNTTYIATLTIIDSGIEGNFKKTSVIDFIDSIQDEFDMGWENEWNYQVFAIVIIILLGTIAGAVHAPVIALIQGAFFLIFLDIGYIPTRLDIVFMGALGIVISYMAAMRKGEEGMRS